MTTEELILGNPILLAVRQLLDNQTVKGYAKYGTTVNPDDYSVEEWINHAQEEATDLLIYLEVLKTKLNESSKKTANEMERLREALEAIAADTKTWTNPDETIPYVNKIAREALNNEL
ncbi:hypothetical protein [Rummeliibacillus stabekisii]|uniref:hypothetical protein n=1 Tax=Rummeliibacillus stabekisii TaxID=241244 RepID=UPI003710BA93